MDRKCLKINESEDGGNRWNTMDVSSAGFDVSFLNPPRNTLWQASTEDQLRNFGMHSFVTAAGAVQQAAFPHWAAIAIGSYQHERTASARDFGVDCG